MTLPATKFPTGTFHFADSDNEPSVEHHEEAPISAVSDLYSPAGLSLTRFPRNHSAFVSPAIHIECVDIAAAAFNSYSNSAAAATAGYTADEEDYSYDADCASEYSYSDLEEDKEGDDNSSFNIPLSPASAAPFEFARQHEVRSLMAAMQESLASKLVQQLAKQEARQREAREAAAPNRKAKGKGEPTAISIAKANGESARGGEILSPGCLAVPPMTWTQTSRAKSGWKPVVKTVVESTYTVGTGSQAVPRSPGFGGYDTAEDTESDAEPLCRTLAIGESRSKSHEDDSGLNGIIFDMQSPRTYVGSDYESGMSAVERTEVHGAPWEEEEERGRTLARW